MTKYKRWRDIRAKGKSPARLARVASAVEKELLDLDLRTIREVLGKTQVQVADATKMTQGEVSRFERSRDHLLSKLRRYVKGLGGELEVVARFGDKSVRLRSAG
jgi:hypothetical protein